MLIQIKSNIQPLILLILQDLLGGASKGEGLGNQFYQILEKLKLFYMVRCFEDGNIIHVEGDVNPLEIQNY